ncbi:hypothetical protein [Nocardioides sp.]|uniref:hypothetical protein n=1 Tax=Nocardioides sp. TaxID=35761 RepID=UPI003783A3C9
MPARPLLRRRSALAAGLAGLTGLAAVGGCDLGDSAPRSGPTSTPGTDPDPDAALVEEVLAELGRAERVATAGGALELAALHRAHIAALDGEPPAERTSRTATPAVVRRREQHLQVRLVEASVAARSGSLARLLASMSAAVSQRLALDGTAA